MKQIQRQTHKIDAEGEVCGRLAVKVANLLRGKEKPEFNYNTDVGDVVFVYNLEKLKFTGRKLEGKKYFHHTGYIGHLKQKTLKEAFKNPCRVFKHAVAGMLPKNRLKANWLKRLKLFTEEINE